MAASTTPRQSHDAHHRMVQIREFLRRRFYDRKWHWLFVVICIWLGEWLASALERDNAFQWIRTFAYQKYQNVGSRKGKSIFNAVVLIDDNTYWQDKWTPRMPISRDLLADLVGSIAKCNPAVISVDIDLATGDNSTTTVKMPASSGRLARSVTLHTRSDWGNETVNFLDAVKAALEQGIEIVLTHEVGREPGTQTWTRFPNVYDGFDFGQRRPCLGHLFYDKDIRVLPLPVDLGDGSRVKSLSIAAAEAYSADTWANEKWDREVLTRLIDPDRLVAVSAHELLHPKDQDSAEQSRVKLRHKVVWIGGAWHPDGFGRGTKTVDAHSTARGDLPGVLLHANYAESLLDDKLLAMGSTWLLEVPLALLVALCLDWAKWPWKGLIILAVIMSPLGLAYVGIQNFGLYFDVVVVSFLLILGIVVETVFGWYLEHRELQRIMRQRPPERPSASKNHVAT